MWCVCGRLWVNVGHVTCCHLVFLTKCLFLLIKCSDTQSDNSDNRHRQTRCTCPSQLAQFHATAQISVPNKDFPCYFEKNEIVITPTQLQLKCVPRLALLITRWHTHDNKKVTAIIDTFEPKRHASSTTLHSAQTILHIVRKFISVSLAKNELLFLLRQELLFCADVIH